MRLINIDNKKKGGRKLSRIATMILCTICFMVNPVMIRAVADKNANVAEVTNGIEILKTLALSCNFNPTNIDEILNLLTGVLHGYTTLQLRYALSRPDEVRAALSTALDTVLTGLHQKYDQHKKEHL